MHVNLIILSLIVFTIFAPLADAKLKEFKSEVQTDCKEQSHCILILKANGVKSSVMYYQSSQKFGEEKCDFFTSRKDDLTAYISICETNGRKEVEGVI